MNKVIKVPTSLVSGPGQQSALMLDGCSVIEQCIHSMEARGTMHLEEHLLLIVLEGTVTLTYGKQQYVLEKNDMILLKKAISVQYDKVGNPDNDNIYDSLMFSLKDDLLKTFLASSEVKVPKIEGEIKTAVYPMNECLVAFALSLKPYFYDDSIVHPGQLRLKIMELLYDVAECNRNMYLQILQLHQPVRADIRHIVEQHYARRSLCWSWPIFLAGVCRVSKEIFKWFTIRLRLRGYVRRDWKRQRICWKLHSCLFLTFATRSGLKTFPIFQGFSNNTMVRRLQYFGAKHIDQF
jgi:hypothetical protein